MDKLTEQLTLKVSEKMLLTINRLAALDGLTTPDLLRKLIDDHLDKKHHDFMVLKRVFEGNENQGI